MTISTKKICASAVAVAALLLAGASQGAVAELADRSIWPSSGINSADRSIWPSAKIESADRSIWP